MIDKFDELADLIVFLLFLLHVCEDENNPNPRQNLVNSSYASISVKLRLLAFILI